MNLSKLFAPDFREITIQIQLFHLKNFWETRLQKFGKRSVLNHGYKESDIPSVTERHKSLTFPILQKHLQGWEKTILDLGCGNGRFSFDLAQLLAGKTVGIDLTEKLLLQAPDHSSVEYRIADSGNLPLPDASMDVVWIFQVLGGLRGTLLRQTVSEIRRVLKKNGLLFLVENTTAKPHSPTWAFRSVRSYQTLFSFMDLEPERQFQDLGEQVSVLVGRNRETSGRGIGNRSYFQAGYSNRDWRFYRPLLTMILTNSEPGPILDIGAGLGYLVEAATLWGLDCQGIEGSPEAIAMARERCPGIRLQHHYLNTPIPFDGESFQTITLNQVIEHLDENESDTVIKEAFRLLKPGGILFIFSPNRFNTRERTLDHTHQRLLTPSELARHLATAGFEEIISRDFPRLLLGNHWLGKAVAQGLFRATGWERLSSSSNCTAKKPLGKPLADGPG